MTLDAIQIIQKERIQDLIRGAEQDRLLQKAKLQRTGQPALRRNLAAWLGVQMVRWGSKMQQCGSASPRKETDHAKVCH
ncbi:MAG: hypothetical protein HYR94_18955 [Chloroflexi bacterium]|nr:hypothetical protein [Chloroflexota bacterium]